MKNFAVTLLVGIFIALFGWWLNQDRADVRFTLSERVPVSFGGETSEAVQQIEVRNLGKKTAERIQVKINLSVIAYEVIKQSAADKVEEFKTADALELVYSVLPPEGSFRVVFKTAGKGVAKENVQVRHERGVAAYAFGSSSPWSYILSTLQGLFLVGYLLLIALTLRDLRTSSLRNDAMHKSEELLRRTRPWFVKQEDWLELRGDALTRMASERIGYDIGDMESSMPFRRLNLDQIDFLTPEEQHTYRVAATENVLAQINSRIYDVYSSERLRPFLSMKRPTRIPPAKWREMHTSLVEKYLSRRVEEVWSGGELDRLREEKPIEISAKEWEESQQRISDKLFVSLAANIEISPTPFAVAESAAARALPEEKRAELNIRSYRVALQKLPDVAFLSQARTFLKASRPTWINDRDYEKLSENAERTIENDALKSVLSRIANRLPIDSTDLAALSSDLRERMTQVDQQIRVEGKRIGEEANRVSTESVKLKRDQEIILKQLAVLNSLFSDPKSVDRIEAYDNPFAAGNFETIKRVAKAFQTTP
jgi:hypothetical protein